MAQGEVRQWSVELVRIGAVPPPVLRELRTALVVATEHPVWVGDRELDPAPSFHPRRRQYAAERLMRELLAPPPPADVKRIGIADVDLFLDLFTHVFGSAQLGGAVAVASLHRLDPRFAGEPADTARTMSRLIREVLHELGHTLGLVHCRVAGCAMHPSHRPEQVDIKTTGYCRLCAERVGTPILDI